MTDVLEASKVVKPFKINTKTTGIIQSLKNAVAAVKESLSFGESFAFAAA